jgi:predicted flap endonuclease-1-like 5' DNA nuclease
MSIYSVPEDMTSGKSWADLMAANMKAFGMPDLAGPAMHVSEFPMPEFKLPDVPQGVAEGAAALAMMPMGFAAAMFGVWAGAMDGAVASARKLAAIQPGLPELPAFEWPMGKTGEVVAFAPKARTPKAQPAKAEEAALVSIEPDAAIPMATQASVSEAVVKTVLAASLAEVAPVAEAVAPESLEPHVVAELVTRPAVEATVAKTAKGGAAKGGSLLDMVADADALAAPMPVVVAIQPMPVETSASSIAPEDFKRPGGIAKPDNPDDLKMISGVGPKIEGILHALGIYTFAQVAGWSAPEIAWVDDYLNFKGRITRDAWIAQADALAAGGRDEYVKRFGKEPR